MASSSRTTLTESPTMASVQLTLRSVVQPSLALLELCSLTVSFPPALSISASNTCPEAPPEMTLQFRHRGHLLAPVISRTRDGESACTVFW